MIINEFVINEYLTLAELTYFRSLVTFNIMLHRPIVMKLVYTLKWAFVLYSFAFFIQVINEVFDCHWMLRFITIITRTALDLEILIYLEY